MIKSQTLKQTGFTLIELLVSISIMLILVSVYLVNFGSLSNSRNLDASINTLVSDLHKLQSYALASRDIGPGNPASSYGIILTTTRSNYTLVGQNNAIPAQQSTLSSSNLAPKILINAVEITKPNSTLVDPTSVTVSFKVPYARIVQSYNTSNGNEYNDVLRIRLQTADSSLCGYVFVNGITGNITTAKCP